jgi:hypothetical protein
VKNVNSFDVFDTLLARRFITSVPLFNQMEAELKIPDFQRRRVAADNGSRTLAASVGWNALCV